MGEASRVRLILKRLTFNNVGHPAGNPWGPQVTRLAHVVC
jgi:hypothetical protein